MASSATQHVVDIDELSASTEEKLLKLPPLSSERCIYSVPYTMRVSSEQHFMPRIVSVGPIHYRNEKLRANEHLKERYLAEFRQHTGVSLKECYKLILEHERRLRNCYAHIIELNSENFVKMVLVDAAFLLMILVYSSCESLISDADLLFKNPEMILDIRFDLLLLENQLPFFILEELYKLSKLQNILKETAMTSLGDIFSRNWDWGIPGIPRRQSFSNTVHILDVLRSCLIPADWTPEWKEIETTSMPSTKELHQAGVKIQAGSEENMFAIIFNDGILEIPPLIIFDDTELVFRNLLAFESCHYPGKQIFSHYFDMMRYLTLSTEDTELLVQNGVIINGLADAEDVTKIFRNMSLGNNNCWEISPYSDVMKDLDEYYKVDWHIWKAILKEKYFKAPWAICSVSAAVFLIVLAMVQAVFSILQVVLRK